MLLQRFLLTIALWPFVYQMAWASINPNREIVEPSLREISSSRFAFISYEVEEGILREYDLHVDFLGVMFAHVPGYEGDLSISDRDSSIIRHIGGLERTSTTRKSLLGLYPRSPVRSTMGYPERTVGLLGDQCSATLIGPNYALTAAHCVWNDERRAFYTQLEFTPGKQAHREPFSSYRPTRILFPKDYWLHGETRSDYALLVFREPIGHRLGWMAFGTRESGSFYGKIMGYPLDKTFGTLWQARCPISLNGSQITHQCDTVEGMSGSPLYVEEAIPFLLGLHTHGGIDTNGGKRITEKMFRVLQAWFEFDFLDTSMDLVQTHELSDETLSFEVKNYCNYDLFYRVEDLNKGWTRISPGETKTIAQGLDLASLRFFVEPIQNLSGLSSWDEIRCEQDCLTPIANERLRLVSPQVYRYEPACSATNLGETIHI